MGGLGQQTRPGGPVVVPAVPHRTGLCRLQMCEEGTVGKGALRLLNNRDVPALEVVAVHTSCVTYLDMGRVLRTAWVVRERVAGGGERVVVWSEPGLPAFPTET